MKNPCINDENQQQIQPTYGSNSGDSTRPHWWKASALTALSLLKYFKIPGLIKLCKGFLVSERHLFWQESVILAFVVWFHVNNCCKGAIVCLYQEGV